MEPSDVELSPWAEEKCKRSGTDPELLREQRACAVDLDDSHGWKLVRGPLRQNGRHFVFTCGPEDHIIHDFADQKYPPSYMSSPAW